MLNVKSDSNLNVKSNLMLMINKEYLKIPVTINSKYFDWCFPRVQFEYYKDKTSVKITFKRILLFLKLRKTGITSCFTFNWN